MSAENTSNKQTVDRDRDADNGSSPIEIHYDEWDEVLGRLDSLEAFKEHVVRPMREDLKEAYDVIEQKQARIDDLESRFDSLESRVSELDARTNMLQVIEQADSIEPKQRSTVLIQHLKRAAEKKGQDGGRKRAAINRDDAEKILHHPDVHRTTIYSDMERAQDLVGDKDVLVYKTSDGKGRRLIMNLDAGSLPTSLTERTVDGFTRSE